MGKLKAKLDNPDITDQREPDLPDPLGESLMLAVGWAMHDIASAIKTLEDNPAIYGKEIDEVEQYAVRLQKIAQRARKPF